MKRSSLLIAAALSAQELSGRAHAAAAERAPQASNASTADEPLPARPRRSDPLFPGGGQLSLALSTGVPFWVMGELSYGMGDHAAIGALAGATPVVSGFGLRPRAELPLSETWGVLGVASGVYYPPTGRAREWWLVRPSVLVERHQAWGNLAAGGGFVAAATNDSLFGGDQRATPSPYPSSASQSFDRGVWLTANALGTLRLSRRTHLFADAALVFDTRLHLAIENWVGGPPAIVFLGVETAL